jgi:hypothetical protein
VADDGSFIVAWDDIGANQADAITGVLARRFDANDDPVGTEFRVNTYTTGIQGTSSVAFDGDGNFVIVWYSDGSSGTDSSDSSIQGQRYDSDGDPAGTEFQINTYTTDFQRLPAVAVASDGDFVVVWDTDGATDTDPDESVRGLRFDQSGDAVGTEFMVNTYTTDTQGAADVAFEASGGFVVAFFSYLSAESDNYNGIAARRFDADGNPLGPQFQVNSYTTGIQADPSVAALSGGGFVVVWDSAGTTDSDGNYGIAAQLFDAGGAFVGTEFQVNTYTTSYQLLADVAPGAGGGFVVVWQSTGSAGSDSSGDSIQGQRFE